MKRLIPLIIFSALSAFIAPVKADFGDADFPIGMFSDGPKSYQNARCRTIQIDVVFDSKDQLCG